MRQARATPNVRASKTRLASIKARRAESRAKEISQLEELKQRLRAARGGRPLTLSDTEADLLLRVVDDRTGTPKRGRPAQFDEYHMWIAIHFEWYRQAGHVPKVAYSEVGRLWGVSRSAIVKAVKKLSTDKERMASAAKFINAISREEVQEAECVLNTMMNRYRDLGLLNT